MIIILFWIKIVYHKQKKFNTKNQVPLHYAAYNNSRNIGELLISKGADINAKDIIYLNLKKWFLINII